MPTETTPNPARTTLDRARLLKMSALTLLLAGPLGWRLSQAPASFAVATSALNAATFTEQVDRAQRLINSGKPREGLAALEHAQQLNPGAFSVHNNRCVAFGMLNMLEEAVAACQRALEIDPTSALARNNLGWVQSIQKK